MTPADEGIAAAKADNEALERRMLVESNARTIKRRAATVLTDIKQYRDPALLDPSDLDEIGRGIEQIRKIRGEAIESRIQEDGAEATLMQPGERHEEMNAVPAWEKEHRRALGAEDPFPAEGAATGGYVGRYYRGRRMTDGSRFWPTPRPVCQHIVESLRDLAEWPAALSDERLQELSNVLLGAARKAGLSIGLPTAGLLNSYRTIVLIEIEDRERANRGRCVEALEETRQMLDSEPTADPVAEPKADPVQDPVEVARSLCSGSENIHTLSGDAALDEARIILLSLKPGTRGHDCLLDAFLAAGISTDIDEPEADLDLVDVGGGVKLLGFEMSLDGFGVLISNQEGGLPDEGENLASLYIDGDERARLKGNFEAVTRWARVIKRELEELQERDQLRFVSWSKFARAFDGVLR